MLIGEVSTRSGISTRMLRHYDRLGLVSPTGRTTGGYRRYSDDDVRRLFQVEGLRSLGLSLQQIGTVLGDLSFSPSSMVGRLITRTREHIAQEQELLHRLERVAASDPAAWDDVLRMTALMRGLDTDSASERQRFALTLGSEPTPDVALLVEAALNETDPHVAGTLSWALARAGDDAIPFLAAALESTEPERRDRALEALVKIGTPQTDAILAGGVDHPDPLVRTHAVFAGARLGLAGVVPALVSLVLEGQYDVEATDALVTLASEHGRRDEIVHALRHALDTTGSDRERSGASSGSDEPTLGARAARQRLAAALAEVPGDLARETLASLLDDPDRQVALTAGFLLRLGGSNA